jgi:peptidoglycan/xylan/chitin deacetylase (PgdA/CDA1 family)
MGLEGRSTKVGESFILKDVEDLLSEGHELGCHTYSHVDCRTLSSAALESELRRNADCVRAILPSYSLVTFAYPFGGVTVAAKALLARQFAVARSVEEGLNAGLIDLALLRAARMYSAEVAVERALRLISEAARRRAWVVFFTHDVDERPSPWGCTPAYLEQVVKAAVESNCEVLTVRNALGSVSAFKWRLFAGEDPSC